MTLPRITLAALLAGASLITNATAGELCFKVEDNNPNGVGTLKLSTVQVGNNNMLAAGSLQVDLAQQQYSVVQVLKGALVKVGNGYKLSLRGTDFERNNSSPIAHTWRVTYHADLDSTMSSGTLKGIMSHFGADQWQQEYREATITACK